MTHVSTGEQIAFWILGPLAVLGALGMVLARNAVHSALCLVVTMLNLGILYVVNQAPFLGFVQIIVYTGAIMMLFLFVLMLVGRDASDSLIETLRGQRVAAILLGLGFALLVGTGLGRALNHTPTVGLDQANQKGNVQGLAALLFTRYVFAFEVTSALLITAAVGAMILAHVEVAKGDKADQVTRMKERFRPGNYPGPKPGPGVYANTMSVAAPARLPDGNGTENSISPILPVRELTASEVAPKGTEK
ncbi:NADH:ubiquinone oxidoreductase subunit J [Actinoplanes sp. SE50]|uniref:NADH-quinone oxidoreductase subunit J n=1 Tax=unclassified Actinoplanes TaxID=2626549 RepID=UPI00023EC1E1|nr:MULTISPECIES: NADH-quinone oxidoreductase subunit J [unclassified Actinoplanes]AEV81351.1 NADH dehydrogenase I subunit J [Actinoplanes sp. SE50/110]ATO79754.1 NADH:ubiquinone oxidoreductase subunit J [Actinoplanes sp. SE50]SLL97157.1 NADH dehydrogenase, subunit J [Actinoplanes sp. SE50/110]